MKNCSLDKKWKELRKWGWIQVIWVMTILFGFATFMQLTKERIIHETNLPWWVFIPCILMMIPSIVLLIKGWQYDKLKKSQNHNP